MLNLVIAAIKGLPKEIAVLTIAALPISELRGAIPLGLSLGMPLFKVFWWSILGNFLPVMPILLLLGPVSERLRRFKLWVRFFDWLFERTRKKADQIQKYEALGLMVFVAIPLPMTGAWTGAVAATLFKIRFRYAVSAIGLGVILAGIVVSVLCTLGIIGWKAIAQ